MKESIFLAAEKIDRLYPGYKVNYLDANFPFFDKFPLFPHLSHNDGKKIDLAFFYRDKGTGLITDRHPSFIGYGVCEEPRVNEFNMAEVCEEKGYWQYGLLSKIISQKKKENFEFDSERTKKIIEELVRLNAVGKILIEPHLKTRLKLTSAKVRFHGCQAVRHDDHMHVQLK